MAALAQVWPVAAVVDEAGDHNMNSFLLYAASLGSSGTDSTTHQPPRLASVHRETTSSVIESHAAARAKAPPANAAPNAYPLLKTLAVSEARLMTCASR